MVIFCFILFQTSSIDDISDDDAGQGNIYDPIPSRISSFLVLAAVWAEAPSC